jgi:cystathionine beta-synthase
VVVVHVPDSGRGYLSKLYNDAWMADYGFLQAAGTTIGDLLNTRDPALPMLVHTHPEESVRQAIAILREYGVSQMPVIKQEPPVVLAEVVGAVTERDLMDHAFADAGVLDRPVGEVMGPPLPTVGAGEPLETAVKRLEGAPAVLVLDRGHPLAVVTRVDVLAALTSPSR